MKLTEAPGLTDWSDGFVVTAGAWLTVTVSVWVPFGLTPLDAVRLNEYAPPEPGCRRAGQRRRAVAVVAEGQAGSAGSRSS